MLSHFSHHVSTGVLVPLLPLLRQGFGLNYFQSGILVSSFSLSYGFGQVPMALLADRFGRRSLIVLGLIGTSLSAMAVGLTNAYWQMVPCFIALGLLGAVRELIGTGSLKGDVFGLITWDIPNIFGASFVPFEFAVQAPGAFVILGLLLCMMNLIPSK